MFSINTYRTPSRQKLRSFALVVASGFFFIGVWPTILRDRNPNRWALAIGLLFAIMGLLVPNALKHVHRVWMGAGNILGWINSKVLLTLIYYVVVTPLSLIMALIGRDPMSRKLEKGKETYRIVRRPKPVSHMKHQF